MKESNNKSNSKNSKDEKDELTELLERKILGDLEKDKDLEKELIDLERDHKTVNGTIRGDEKDKERIMEIIKKGSESEQLARVKSSAEREAKVRKIQKRTEKEAEKEVNKKLKEIGAMQGSYVKRKIVSKLAGKAISETAYAAAQGMAEKAESGGAMSVVIIIMTIGIAALVDLADIISTILTIAGVVSVAGIPIGVVTALLWIIGNLLLNPIIIIFWMLVLGGGHKRWFWKRVARLFVWIFIADSLPILDVLPFTLFVVLWNSYDFFNDKKKARKDLHEFKIEYQKTGKINKKYASYI